MVKPAVAWLCFNPFVFCPSLPFLGILLKYSDTAKASSHRLTSHNCLASILLSSSSVRYGLTDIQEYYANTGALKKAAENNRGGRRVGKPSSASYPHVLHPARVSRTSCAAYILYHILTFYRCLPLPVTPCQAYR